MFKNSREILGGVAAWNLDTTFSPMGILTMPRLWNIFPFLNVLFYVTLSYIFECLKYFSLFGEIAGMSFTLKRRPHVGKDPRDSSITREET